MHSYMKAIGFTKEMNRQELEHLLNIVKKEFDVKVTAKENDKVYMEISKEFAPEMGITIFGELDEQGFHPEYYFPYLSGTGITSDEDLIVEKHIASESFAAICEDLRVGVSLIFYVQNIGEYKRENSLSRLGGQSVNTTFSGLGMKGKILFPIQKSEEQLDSDREATQKRNNMIAAARNGDEEAIESLTLEDIDMYTMVSRRIMNEDVFSIVDTFFMPYGMECDQYHILGEILSCRKVRNILTEESIYIMKIQCNELEFDICINVNDLMGEPEEGRRFKGVIWLQGRINFPE